MKLVKNLIKWPISETITALYNSNSFSPIFLDSNQAELLYENRGKTIIVEDLEFKKLLKDNFITLSPIFNNKNYIHKQYIKRLGNTTTLNIRFMASYECNQNCEYCMTRFVKEKIKGHFDCNNLDKLPTILNTFFKYSPFASYDKINVKLIGGEPTMPKSWEINKKFLKVINSLCKDNEHTIVTNGDYLDDNLLKEFKEYNIKYIYLSFDIRNAKNNNNGSKYRNELIEFTKKCELIEKYNIGIKIDFKCDKDTILTEEIISFIKERLKHNAIILNSPIIGQEDYDALISPQCDKYDLLSKQKNNIYPISKQFFDLNESHGSWPKQISAMVYRCNAATLTNICIYPNGLITGCGKLYSSNIDNVPIIADLKTGIVNKDILLKFKQNTLKDKECKKCEYTFICGGKCPLKKDRKCNKERIGTELLLQAYTYTINSLNKKSKD